MIISVTMGKALLIFIGLFLAIAGIAHEYKAPKLRNWAITASVLLIIVILGALKHGAKLTPF